MLNLLAITQGRKFIHAGPKVSIVCFFSPAFHPSSRTYGPIKELLSEENLAKYREFSIPKFTAHYRTKFMKDTSPLLFNSIQPIMYLNWAGSIEIFNPIL